MNTPSESIKRASRLLATPIDPEDYIIIKILPDGGGCCCTHCWPETWQAVNHHIHPAGPIEHEGDVVVGRDGNAFVLEGHESGPEIVVYLNLTAASILLLKSVIDLVATILKNVDQNRSHAASMKLIKRVATKGEFEDETILEIDLPLSEATTKKLESTMTKALTKRQTKHLSRRGAR